MTFVQGSKLIFSCTGTFFRTKELWKYCIVPSVVTLGANAAMWVYAFLRILPGIDEKLSSLCSGSWFAFLGTFLYYLTAGAIVITMLLLSAFLSGFLYEFTGSFFMGPLVRKFLVLNGKKVAVQSFADDVKGSLATLLYSAVTGIIFIIGLFVPSIFLPVFFLLCAWRTGVNYSAEGGFARGLSFADTRVLLRRHFPAPFAMGIMASLILSVPLLNVIFLPGMHMGGAVLVGKLLDEEASAMTKELAKRMAEAKKK